MSADEQAFAMGLIRNMCAGNIEQAKRMLGIGDLNLTRFHLREAIGQIDQMESLAGKPSTEDLDRQNQKAINV